ncbi:MaoC family dehydratase N-terminal domain-containing protein [Microbacterium sp. zg-Y818]|uniref:MaoC family dehydratase N-terminal domain-containing protein n=1 Tax=unclassified Microbacterium TaxID=2609290 RepID=UPI00214B45FD|nr:MULTISPECIES: MaoC family dehydratase N-terminal domain-containing protein [unclassified Microbacterium]MCR2799330.1 MaoC family dehydratase N-terminal domain-containing protein [Microbacterium sp. zg.Y818]WIM21331.1 MaoC family dehydratase N-terminal domain-containing protein [Microbacterium sp. zg-Y818]
MSRLSELVGTTAEPFRFVVEEGKVAEFARAVQATDPLFRDPAAAAAAGLSGVLAPPTFSAASAHWSAPASSPALGLDLTRVLAGGGEWEYLSPIVAGDRLEAVTTVESVVEKVGSRGPMAVIRVRTDYARDGEVVQRYTSNIIQFGPVDEGSAA